MPNGTRHHDPVGGAGCRGAPPGLAASLKAFGEKVLALALSVAGSILLLQWAFAALRPMLPFVLLLAAGLVVVPIAIRRYRGW